MTEPVRCLIAECDRPGEWTSPTGHTLCIYHHEIYQELELDREPEGLQPVNLTTLMAGEAPEEEWALAPLIPAGKLCGIVSKRGAGKSLLLLDLACAKATGQAFLHQDEGEPEHVIYVDMEMGPDDLYERLADLGYHQTHPHFQLLATHLHYYQLVALPPLDTEEGGEALEELVDRHNATLVIVDTVSRVVTGAENDAEPYRNLFRHTETRLKRRRITLIRLDHLGKDTTRGSRGSSAKEDPLDVVWQLETGTVEGTLTLTLTKGRQAWIPRSVTIKREETDGETTHVIPYQAPEEWLLVLVDRIEHLELAPDTSVRKTVDALRESGSGARRQSVSAALKYMRGPTGSRLVTKQSGSQKPGATPPTQNGSHPGNHSEPLQETLTNIGETMGATPGTTPEPLDPGGGPTGSGTHLDSHPEIDLLDPDLEDLDIDPADYPDPY